MYNINIKGFVRKALVIFLLAIGCTVSFAQTRTVKGKITDVSGEPLPGAAVLIEGTSAGTGASTSIMVYAKSPLLLFDILSIFTPASPSKAVKLPIVPFSFLCKNATRLAV